MRIFHVGLSVRGAMRDRELAGLLFDPESGRKLSAVEVHTRLCDCIADGIEMIPLGEVCEGWDWKIGCQGHEK